MYLFSNLKESNLAIELQRDTSGCSQGFVDIKIKVAF